MPALDGEPGLQQAELNEELDYLRIRLSKSVGATACSDLWPQIPLNPLSLGLVFPGTPQPPSISSWSCG